MRYLIIVHDDNISKLEAFLAKHPRTVFDIIEATYPYPDEMSGPTLSKENKLKIIVKYGNRMTRESFHRLLNGKDFEKIQFL